jgi:hypothetical protein
MRKKCLSSGLAQATSFQRKGCSELSRCLGPSLQKCAWANLLTLTVIPVMRREDGDVARLSGSLFQKYETTSVVEVSSTPTLLHVVKNQMENAQPGEVHRYPIVVVADSTLFWIFKYPSGRSNSTGPCP